MDEFELITRCFRDRATRRPDTVLGIGDDAALLDTGGRSLVHARATVSFCVGDDPGAIACRAFGGALLRLAARGPTPRWATLGLTLEADDRDWIEHFSTVAAAVCSANTVELIGGDTTRGPGRVTVFALGAQDALSHRPAPRPGEASSPRTDEPEPETDAGRRPGSAGVSPIRSVADAPRALPDARLRNRSGPRTGNLARSPTKTPLETSRAVSMAARLSLAAQEAPERVIADLVSTCAALAGRGAKIRWSDAPGAGGVLEFVAQTDEIGEEALRAVAARRRGAFTLLEAKDRSPR